MKETSYQRRITDMATRFGWKWWHVPTPMRWSPSNKAWVPAKEGRGLPDLILLHSDPPRLVIAEIKGDGGELSDEQAEFLRLARDVAQYVLESLHDAGSYGNIIGVYVFTPADEHLAEQILRTKILM